MDNENRTIEELPLPELDYSDPPIGSDRRAFMVRSAMATAIGMLAGTSIAAFAQAAANAPLQGKENPTLKSSRSRRVR